MKKDKQLELLKLVQASYDQSADKFARSRKSLSWGPLDEILKTIPIPSSVLDVGCGSGRIINSLPAGIDYLGVDNSQKLLDQAQQEFPEQKFKLIDILELEKIGSDKFDYVLCIAALHHLPGKDLRQKALEQLKSKLSDQGVLVVTVWNLWQNKKLKKKVWQSYLPWLRNGLEKGDLVFSGWNDGTLRYYHAFTRKELRGLVKEVGLKIEMFRKDSFNYYLVLKK